MMWRAPNRGRIRMTFDAQSLSHIRRNTDPVSSGAVHAGLHQGSVLSCTRWGGYDTFIEAFCPRWGLFVAWVFGECSTMAVFNGASGPDSFVAPTNTNTI